MPTWFQVRMISPFEGYDGSTAFTYYDGGLNTRPEFETTQPGYAYIDAPSAGEAVRHALTGTVRMHAPPPSLTHPAELHSYTFSPGSAGFAAADHKAFLIQPNAVLPISPPPPPTTPGADLWGIYLEDLSFDPTVCDWDYNDRSWVAEVLALETPPTGAEMVAGRVWTDVDEDGIQNANEPGEPWRTVTLLRNGVALGLPTLTDEDGSYSFHFVRQTTAEYKVQFEQPTGYNFTTDFAGGDRTIDSDADENGLTPEVFSTSAPATSIGGGLAVVAQYGREWTIPNVDQAEGSGVGQTHQITFTVTRRTNIALATSVGYKTVDGTASAGSDYVAVEGTLNFAANQASATVTVTINEDTTKENDEEFFLVLKDPDFAVMPDGTTEAGRRTPFGRGIIRNDDYPANYVDHWSGWEVDPHKPGDVDTNYKNGTWMRGWDGDTPTYLTPTGTPWVHSMVSEGPYLKTTATYTSFVFTVDWRVADVGQRARPMDPKGAWRQPENAEQFGNSGVYIYDRYEVQVISTGVGFNQPVGDQGQSPKTALTPGWPYKVPPPAGKDTINFSATPGGWNRMIVEFYPPVITSGAITQAAKLKVSFEYTAGGLTTRYVAWGDANGGWDLVNGTTKLKATGNKQDRSDKDFPPVDLGSLFLQSHWGSLVEFKNPNIEELMSPP